MEQKILEDCKKVANNTKYKRNKNNNKMKQIKQESELVGKIIEKQGSANNTFALFFKDNTFAIFRGCGSYDRGCGLYETDVELMDEDYNLEPNTSNFFDLKDLGTINETEFQKLWHDYNEKEKIKTEEKERLQYEKLKLKYRD